MTLATKNGAIIVKDGLLAENCGCCGGWYCSADPCPCNYSKAIPQTLNASFAVSLPSTIYSGTFGAGSGGQAFVRLTDAQAAAFNGTYQLQREANCQYSYPSPLPALSSPDSLFSISVIVGTPYSLGQDEDYRCSDGYTVQLYQLRVVFQSSYSQFFGSSFSCANAAMFSNAASNDYSAGWLFGIEAVPSATKSFLSGCTSLPFVLRNKMAAGIFDANSTWSPQCDLLIDQIDHSWTLDLQYTDTSGAFPENRVIPSALTLRVYE